MTQINNDIDSIGHVDTVNDQAANPAIRLAVIIGSIRDGRIGGQLADWLISALPGRGGVDIDLIDLADHDLPLTLTAIGGPPSPIADRLARADAFLIVVPEYNHSFPAALKNAIDRHFAEWAYKPVGFVGYGAGSGGVRAVEQLSQVFRELRAVTTRDSVLLSAPWTRLSSAGGYTATTAEEGALRATLDELTWYARLLRAGRERGLPGDSEVAR